MKTAVVKRLTWSVQFGYGNGAMHGTAIVRAQL